MVGLTIALGYILGSFPTAYLIAKANGVDIFTVGSGNMGANNVARSCGLQYGLLVWAIDGAKGILAVILARYLLPENLAAANVLGAIAVVAGHNWSVLATIITGSLRGGKGAATASGTLLLLLPTLVVAGAVALGAVIVLLTRYVSLGVLTMLASAALAFVVLVLLGTFEPVYLMYLLVVWMVFFQHRANIVRLVTGKERRLGERA
ncbi:MAG: glycerol-3-phosphate acyltransferase [Anaerolineae bacterium]|nr:glycerol-3-phosphate acyltransferase [Anaerolineae bacterium]